MRAVRYRVHAEIHQSLHLARVHVVVDIRPAPVLVHARRGLRQLRVQPVAELVLPGGILAVKRLHLGNHETGRVGPTVHRIPICTRPARFAAASGAAGSRTRSPWWHSCRKTPSSGKPRNGPCWTKSSSNSDLYTPGAVCGSFGCSR